MRFLYADSSPFPHPVNLVTTLERFVTAAVTVVGHEVRSRAMTADALRTAEDRARALAALEAFHAETATTFEARAALSALPQIKEFARQVTSFGARLAAETKAGAERATADERAALVKEVDKRRIEIKKALEVFFLEPGLPIESFRLSFSPRDGKRVAEASIDFPEGVTARFELSPTRVPPWNHAMKISAVAKRVELWVGATRGIFRRSSKPGLVAIDDHILSSLTLSPKAAKIAIRKRANDNDSLIFDLERAQSVVTGRVSRPLDEDPSFRPLADSDGVPLSDLLRGLDAAALPLLDARTTLLGLAVDGEDVFAGDLAADVVERLVRYLAPQIEEIADRSPNRDELAIKIEHDNGRREECYVKRGDLRAKLAPLGDKERALFKPLGI